MAAPTHGAWLRGALYLAGDDTAAASPMAEVIDFSYDVGQNNEERPFTNPTNKVTPRIALLSSPSCAINYNRRSDESKVAAAVRHWRDNGTGVRFYLYLDVENEAAKYLYGKAGLEGVSTTGGASAALAGSFTLVPGPEAEWSDQYFDF